MPAEFRQATEIYLEADPIGPARAGGWGRSGGALQTGKTTARHLVG
jgi:hypothetical protein